MGNRRKITKVSQTLALSAFVCQFATVGGLSQTPAGAFTVQGVLEVKSLRFSDKQKSYYYDVLTYGFEVFVDDCRWLMKLGTHDPKVYDYRIISSDGENTYLLLSYETRQSQSAAQGLPARNVGDGAVRKGTIPCFSIAGEAGAVWIAYASGCHFIEHAHDERREVPFADYIGPSPISSGDNLFVEHASFFLNDSPPYVPRAIAYYIQDLAKEGFEAPIKLSARNPFLNVPFTNVNFQTLSFTDFEGLRLPKQSTLSIYRPNLRLLPEIVPQLCEEIHLATTNIVLGVSLASFKPPLPGKTIISEQRLNNGTGLNFAYWATNDWPSEAAAKASRSYAAARRVALGNAIARERNTNLLPRMLIIGALIALPLVLWLRYWKKRA